VVGVLDVQSQKQHAFSENDVLVLKTLANQVAVAIENAQLYARAEKLAITDALTGLHNRRNFYGAVEREMARVDRYSKRVMSLIMVDIDCFKDYNDRYGHLAGDALLKRLAEIFLSETRKVDVISRYGGEEFTILLPETSRTRACKLAERIRSTVERSVFTDEKGRKAGRVTVSLGISCYPGDGKTTQDIIGAADRALYRAKARGKNCCCVSGDETQKNGSNP
jgi:diguanylate cyclase (GGDEF)-like protein